MEADHSLKQANIHFVAVQNDITYHYILDELICGLTTTSP